MDCENLNVRFKFFDIKKISNPLSLITGIYVSEANKIFKILWKHRNQSRSVSMDIKDQVKILLVEAEVILHILMKGLGVGGSSGVSGRKRRVSRHSGKRSSIQSKRSYTGKSPQGISTPMKREALNSYLRILKFISRALTTMNNFDSLKALYWILELFEGTLAFGKGPEAYQKFQVKYNSAKYNIFKQ